MSERTLTHWKKVHNPEFIGSWALQPGEEIIATIESLTTEQVKSTDGKSSACTVARFVEKNIKPMILNKTNKKIMEKIFKTPYLEEWVGRKIQIYSTPVSAFGEQVEALRIRPKEPTTVLAELTPDHPRWGSAVAAIASGANTIAGIRKSFRLSAENERILLSKNKNTQEHN